MSTSYPTDLPQIPDDRWGLKRLRNGGDPDEGTAWTEFSVPDADVSAETAEKRVLAHIDYDYEDDLRGAVATATATNGSLVVRVQLARPRY